MEKCREDKVMEATIKLRQLKNLSKQFSGLYKVPDDSEVYDIAIEELSRSISRNPKYELPVNPGTYLLKNRNDVYFDAYWDGNNFREAAENDRGDIVYWDTYRIQDIKAWWLLPRE